MGEDKKRVVSLDSSSRGMTGIHRRIACTRTVPVKQLQTCTM